MSFIILNAIIYFILSEVNEGINEIVHFIEK